MRAELAVSTVIHAGIITWGLVAFPEPNVFETQDLPALPIELVSIEDITRLSAGEKTGEAKKPPAVRKIEAPAPAENKPEPKLEPKPEPKREVEAEPEPKPDPKPEPEPKAEPTPKPEPTPAAAEPTPAEAAPADKPKLLANAPVPERRPKVIPRPKPEPVKEKPNKNRFDPNEIAALLNKTPDAAGGASQSAQTADTPALGVGDGTAERLSLSDIDALRQQISRCWNPPLTVMEAQGLVVRMNIGLSRDGFVQSGPSLLNNSADPLFQLAAEAAMRAVSGCQPYSLPPEKYAAWQDINLNFDPREMMR